MAMSQAPLENAGSVGEFAKKVILDLHRTIIIQEDGVVQGEIEAVHDMRVAIRRLRVALINFTRCLPREDRRRLSTYLEHLAEALGKVRDLDVLISALERTRMSRPIEDHQAIKSLIKRLKSRRRRSHASLIKYLQNQEFSAFKREFSIEPVEVEQAKEMDGQAA